jgi:DNA-binding transcriptional MocR family regulator
MSDDSSARIVAGLRAWITQAPPGARVPSNRALMAQYGASPVTVQKAMRTLGALGLVESRPGVGTFVRAARTARAPGYGWQTAALGAPRARIPTLSSALRSGSPDTIDLHGGYPDRTLLPERLVRSALARAARGAAALARSDTTGLPELRAWFATELAEATRPGVTPPAARDVVVVPGSQSGLSSIFRALVGFGRPVLLESPTYWGAILAAAQAGVRAVPVPSGPDGPDPAELARAFDETGARVLYAQPNHANPTGAQWTGERAEQVLEVVRARGAFLVEDDWAHDLGIDGAVHPLAAQDDAGHVIYLRSLTKSVSPSVRVAAVVARGPARDRVLADRGAESMYVSDLLQAAALDVVTQRGWHTHLRGLGQQLRARRDLLVDSLAEHVPDARLDHVPRGGLHLWARLPDGTDLDRLVRDCEADGVLIAPGSEWFPAEPAGPYVRLNYTGPAPERFPDGARVLGRALARQHP